MIHNKHNQSKCNSAGSMDVIILISVLSHFILDLCQMSSSTRQKKPRTFYFIRLPVWPMLVDKKELWWEADNCLLYFCWKIISGDLFLCGFISDTVTLKIRTLCNVPFKQSWRWVLVVVETDLGRSSVYTNNICRKTYDIFSTENLLPFSVSFQIVFTFNDILKKLKRFLIKINLKDN